MTDEQKLHHVSKDQTQLQRKALAVDKANAAAADAEVDTSTSVRACAWCGVCV